MATRDIEWAKATLHEMKALAARYPDGWTTITDTSAERVEHCPAQAAGNDWPGWSSTLAARQVGLAAVRSGILDARDAIRAGFDSLLEDSDADRSFQRVQDWIATLSKTARLDVADEALRWLVAWRSVGPDVSGSAIVERGAVQARIGTEITLRAAADVLVRPPRDLDSTVYVSTGAATGENDDRSTAARVAAVLWLGGTSLGTVVVLHPKSRQVRTFAVDTELASIGAEQYLAAMRVIVNQALGVEQAARLTGPQCRWCDRRVDCLEGQQYLRDTPRVAGGLPIALP